MDVNEQQLWEATRIDGSLELEEESFRDIQLPPSPNIKDDKPNPDFTSSTPDEVEQLVFNIFKTENRLNPAIFHSSRMVLFDEALQHEYGIRTATITEATYHDKPCYLVNILTVIENIYSEVLKRSITAYISPQLQTLVQSCFHTHVAESEKESKLNFAQEMILDDEGNMVVTESGTILEADRYVVIKAKDLKGFLSEGSLEIFLRLCVSALGSGETQLLENLKILGWEDGKMNEIELKVELEKLFMLDQNQTSATSIVLSERKTEKKTESSQIETTEKDSLIRGFHQKYENNFYKNPGVLEYAFDKDGTTIYSNYLGFQFIRRMQIKQEVKNENEINSSPNFCGNIELISEYMERKNETKDSHMDYIQSHPDLRDILSDYLQIILHRKPEDVFAFTHEYFTI